VQHRQGIGFSDELGVEVEVKIQATLRLGRVKGSSHEKVSGIVVPLGLDETPVEPGQLRIRDLKIGGQDLELLAAPTLHQRATDQMIDGLMSVSAPYRPHQARNPGAGEGLSELDGAFLEQVQHQLKMLQFLDGNRVELFNSIKPLLSEV
jgi:hypothetical protein